MNTLKFDIVCSPNPWPPQPETAGTWRKVARIPPPSVHSLALTGNSRALRRAHRRRANLDQRDWFGRTPLHLASISNTAPALDCVGTLLRRGADLGARDKRGLTPQDWAQESGNTGALHLFDLWRRTSPERRAYLRAQAGFTFIELMIGLFAIGIVSLGVYGMFFTGGGAADVAKAQADTAALADAATSAYVSRASFAGLTTQSAMAERWVPAELLDASGMPVNTWKQPISLGAVDVATVGDAKGLAITQNVPTQICARYVSNVAGAFDGITINSTDVHTIPMDPATVATACGSGGDTATLVLVRRHS